MPQPPDPTHDEIWKRAADIRAARTEQQRRSEVQKQGVRILEVKTPPGEYFRNIVRGEN